MDLSATHTTTYLYSEPVSICHTEVHLTPRNHGGQNLLEHALEIKPAPDCSLGRQDFFGNSITYFSIHEPHKTLTITSRNIVRIEPADHLHAWVTPAWEKVREQVRQHGTDEDLDALQFVYESPRIMLGPSFAEYAAPSFPKARPFLESVLELCERIYKEFKYDKEATTVRTPVDEVLRSRHGVCQDFAHVMIACLRSLELPARYVSGYIGGGDSMTGAGASHAWVGAFCPGFGWLDFDQTNNMMPEGKHVTLSWGRDYSDVTPVKGVALSSGSQVINVSVEVKPVAVPSKS